jgi:hypothetical protein
MGVQGLQDWAQHFGFAGIARETRVPRGQRWTPIVSARHQESNNGCPGFHRISSKSGGVGGRMPPSYQQRSIGGRPFAAGSLNRIEHSRGNE